MIASRVDLATLQSFGIAETQHSFEECPRSTRLAIAVAKVVRSEPQHLQQMLPHLEELDLSFEQVTLDGETLTAQDEFNAASITREDIITTFLAGLAMDSVCGSGNTCLCSLFCSAFGF